MLKKNSAIMRPRRQGNVTILNKRCTARKPDQRAILCELKAGHSGQHTWGKHKWDGAS